MKKKLFTLFTSILCALFIVSCNNVNNESATEKKAEKAGEKAEEQTCNSINKAYVKVIPDDAVAIIKIQWGNIISKSGIADNAFVEAAIEDTPDEIKQILKGLCKDPNSAGIDTSSPVYLTVTSDAQVIATCGISSMTALEKTLSTLTGNNLNATNMHGMKCIIPESKIIIAYDSEKLVFLNARYNPDLNKFLKLTDNRMAVNNAKYSNFFKCADDVACTVNIMKLMELGSGKKRPDDIPEKLLTELKNVTLNASLDFKKGKATMKADINANNEYTNTLKSVFNKPTHSHFGYIPANSYAVLNYNLDLKKLYDFIEEQGALAEIENESEKKMIESAASALSGEWTVAAWIENNNLEEPFIMAIIDCKERFVFDMIVANQNATYVDNDVYDLNLNKREVYDYHTGQYRYEKTNKTEYYIIYRNGAIMVMPKHHYYRLKSGNSIRQLENSANSNKAFSSMKSNLVIDVEPIRSIFSNQIANSGQRMNEEMMIANEILGMIQDATASFNFLSLNADINMTDKNTNSLKTIVDKALSIAIRYNNNHASYDDRFYDDYDYSIPDVAPAAAAAQIDYSDRDTMDYDWNYQW